MSNTEFQPVLPAEVAYTEAELNFHDESPPGLFPDNQNSNFGFIIRKVFSDQMQTVIDQIETLYQERFISGSEIFLDRWEADLSLPIAPTGKTLAERRSIALGRVRTGPFTRDRVKAVVEGYLQATSGDAIALTPEGVALSPAGIPLYGEFAPVDTLFRVYENIRNFTYEVWIKNTSTPDVASLTRELLRITPAGIQFTIDNTKTNVLNYHRAVRNKQPVAYYRLNGNVLDESDYANNGTFFGSMLTTGGSGLLHTAVQHDLAGNTDEAIDFNGTTNYFTVPNASQIRISGVQAWEAWVRPDVLPTGTGANQYAMAMQTAGLGNYLGLIAPGYPVFTLNIGGVTRSIYDPTALVAGLGYHLVGTWDGDKMRLYKNGALIEESVSYAGDVAVNTSGMSFGRYDVGNTYYFNGVMDEIALYNTYLDADDVLENYNTGTNVA